MKLMKKTLFLALSLMMMLIINIASAEQNNIEIDLNPQLIYNDGGIIQFDYSFLSPYDIEMEYDVGIECQNKHHSFATSEIGNIKAGVLFSDRFDAYIVDSSVESQPCKAYVKILEPIQMIKQKDFTISTEPSFDLQVFVCKDSPCVQKSKVFAQGETAYFDYNLSFAKISSFAYNSNVFGLEVTGKILDKIINLPGNVVLNKIGTHKLEIEAKKQGYKSHAQILEIVVLKGEPQVIDVKKSESEKIKSEEVEVKEKIETTENWIYYALGGIISLLIILIALETKKRKVKIINYQKARRKL